jgi:hypothetical protein
VEECDRQSDGPDKAPQPIEPIISAPQPSFFWSLSQNSVDLPVTILYLCKFNVNNSKQGYNLQRMTSKILINAVDPEEVRLAIVKDSRLEEFHIESAAREILHSSIYKGVITRIEPSLQAVFVDFGVERHGFLQKQEIHSDYYQGPADQR